MLVAAVLHGQLPSSLALYLSLLPGRPALSLCLVRFSVCSVLEAGLALSCAQVLLCVFRGWEKMASIYILEQ